MIIHERSRDLRKIGNEISTAVKEFAESHACDYELWYHDEPIWFVRQEPKRGFYCQVQIAAFSTDQGEKLYVTPFAYAEVKGIVKITPCAPENSKTLLLTELYCGPNSKKSIERIKALIEDAWRIAKQLNRKHLAN